MGKAKLKSVLRNFLNHFETLESQRKSCFGDDLYMQEFQSLKDLTESLKNDPNCTSSEGEKDVNRRKNRYKDILPYDHSRVILSEYPGVPGSDYINANYVRGSSGSSCAYIASQGPLPNTVVDFWRMIWESEVVVIVMACNEREAGKYKCECYWPEENDGEQQYGNITVKLVKWRQVCPDFLVRTLSITADNCERTVCQFHYTTWPDHGVPNSVQPILEVVRLMRDVQVSESRPILVHCSAGCGRTGTICSIDYVWALLRTGKLNEDFSLYEIIKDMRRQRIAMVQTVEQYMLCYKAVATLFEQHLKMIDAHTYENIDEDGEPLLLKELGLEETERKSLESTEEEEVFKEREAGSDSLDSTNSLLLHKKRPVQNKPRRLQKPLLSKSATLSSIPIATLRGEDKHERLVGKATVIRRPSIAKLKAIFEYQNFETGLTRSRSGSSLQRSQSTKETRSFRPLYDSSFNHNSDNEDLSDTNFNTSNFDIRNQSLQNDLSSENKGHRNGYTSNQPPQTPSKSMEHQQHFYQIQQHFQNLSLNQRQLRPEMRPSYQNKTIQFNQAHPIYNLQQINSESRVSQAPHFAPVAPQLSYRMQHAQSLMQQAQRSTHIQNNYPQLPLKPPPKPPRTYQHVVRGIQQSDESHIYAVPNPASRGRVIGSVASAKIQLNNDSNNSSNYELLLKKHTFSTPNLSGNNNSLNNNSLYEHSSKANGINPCQSRIYESVTSKYGPQNKTNHEHNQKQSSIYEAIYGENGAARLPFENPSVQQSPSKKQQRIGNIYENLYSAIGNKMQNNNSKPSVVRQPVTYVRPQNQSKAVTPVLPQIPQQFVEKQKKNKRKEKPPLPEKKPKLKKQNVATNNLNDCNQPHSSSSTSFSAFANALRGFRFKRKNKSHSTTNNLASVNSAVTGNGTQAIRPPHSHRFNPPTQWTQV